MKLKCPECGKGKARRLCHRAGDVEICSACCAAMRDPDCGDCPHYAEAQKYETSRRRSGSRLTLGAGELLMEIDPDVTDAVNRAVEAAQGGEFQRPMDDLLALLPDHPRHHDLPHGIALIHSLKGEHRESIEWFDRAIDIDPHSLGARFNRAVSFEKLLDLHRSLRGFQTVISMGAVDDDVVVQARSILKDREESILKTFGVGLEDYLRSAERFEEATERMDAKDWSAALEGFRASVALNDFSPSCHGNMGICHIFQGRKAEALAALDRALEIDPDYEPARSNRKIALRMIEGKPMDNANYESINFAEEKRRSRCSGAAD